MARAKRSPITSRRSLAGLGTIGIVAGTVAIGAGLSAPDAHAATSAALKYDCTATVFGSTLDQGVWTATVSSDLPASVAPGADLPAPKITADVTSSTAAADTLRNLNITAVDGTSEASYTVSGAVSKPGDRSAGLTIPNTTVPATGGLKTTATGTGAAETAADTPGTITVKVGDFTADIQTYQGDAKSLVIPITCKLQAGQNTTLGTIAVGASSSSPSSSSSSSSSSSPSSSSSSSSSSPSSSSSSSSSSSPSSSSSSPTDTGTPTDTSTGTPTGTSTGTGTATETATGTDTGTATSTGVTGPPVVTDGGSTDGGLNGTVIGGAAAAVAGIGALGAGLRRRLTGKR